MNFFKRNTPVLVIGGLTLLVFLGIIAMGQKKLPISPVMTEVRNDHLYALHSHSPGAVNAETSPNLLTPRSGNEQSCYSPPKAPSAASFRRCR